MVLGMLDTMANLAAGH